MKRNLITLLNDPHISDPLYEVVIKILDKCEYGQMIGLLTKSEKVIFHIHNVEGQVNNGGFHQYHFNSTGRYASEAREALILIKAHRTADLLEEATEIYGHGPTTDNRFEWVQEQTTEQFEKLDRLDQLFYNNPENIRELQLQYIKDHISDFE